MVIDEATIQVTAGHGGRGKVSFFPGGKQTGPDGGNGGRGADVIVRANRQLVSLDRYVRKQKYRAEDGGEGQGFRRQGKDGDPLILDLPLGTLLKDLDSGAIYELLRDGQQIVVCKGGKGGKGNDFFKSSTNTTPLTAQPGLNGDTRRFKLVMRYLADFGLIGLPNAGKSSLLNELTAASVKTANYPFTTLEPNLGVVNGYVMADIPGLIEGASEGRGLGIRFLKHVEKVTLLLHCIGVDSEDPVGEYKTVRKELEQFNPDLLKKKEIILLTKTDLVEPKDIKKKVTNLKKLNPNVLTVSIHDLDAIEALKKALVKEVQG